MFIHIGILHLRSERIKKQNKKRCNEKNRKSQWNQKRNGNFMIALLFCVFCIWNVFFFVETESVNTKWDERILNEIVNFWGKSFYSSNVFVSGFSNWFQAAGCFDRRIAITEFICDVYRNGNRKMNHVRGIIRGVKRFDVIATGGWHCWRSK